MGSEMCIRDSLRGTYRELIRLRRTLPHLTDPRRDATSVQTAADERWVRWDRRVSTGGDGSVVVLLAALGEEPMPLPADLAGARMLAGHDDDGPLAAVPDVLSAPGFVLVQAGAAD